ncbi:hypothetical protein VT06_06930 [Arsukibacterium sp. MJ3]|nr:hypothetical protein VT06_06930 [Arsukibacterium sp. MJ3]
MINNRLRLSSLIWSSVFFSSLMIVLFAVSLVLLKTLLFKDNTDHWLMQLPDTALALLATVLFLFAAVSNKRYLCFAGLLIITTIAIAGLLWYQPVLNTATPSWLSSQSRLPLWQSIVLLLLCLPWFVDWYYKTWSGLFKLRLLCHLVAIAFCLFILLARTRLVVELNLGLGAFNFNTAAAAYSALLLIILAVASWAAPYVKRRAYSDYSRGSNWLLVGFITFAATSLWFNFAYQLQTEVRQTTNDLADRLQHNVDELVAQQRGLLNRLAERLNVADTTLALSYVEVEFQSYLRDFPYIDYLAVQGAAGQLLYAKAQQQHELPWFNQYLQQQNLLFQQLPAWQNAQEISIYYDSAIDHAFLMVTLPSVNQAGVKQLVASVDFSKALNHVLHGIVPKGYFIQLLTRQSQSRLYDSKTAIPHTTYIDSFDIDVVPGQRWQLQVFTNLKTDATSSLLSAEVMLLAGWLATVLVMLSQKLYQQSQRHRARLLVSNNTLRQNIAELQRLERQHQQIMTNSADMICVISRQGNLVQISASCQHILGYREDELLGRAFIDFVHPDDKIITDNVYQKILETSKLISGFRNRYLRKDGSEVYLTWEANYVASLGLLYATARNATDNIKAEQYQNDQQTVLRMMSTEQPLTVIFNSICQMAERQNSTVRAAVMLENSQQLELAAAPSLSPACKTALHRFTVADNQGCCGTAAYHKSLVLVASIANDEKWRAAAPVLVANELLACWSMPMVSLQDNVLGTFALYCTQSRNATKDELELMITCSRFAAVAIERARHKHQLQQSEQRYRSLFHFNPEPVYVINPKGYFIDMNQAGCQLLEHSLAKIKTMHYEQVILPEHLARVHQHFASVLAGNPERFEASIVSRTGKQLELYISIVTTREDDKVTGVIGISKDITQRLKAEQQLQLFKRAVDATSNGVVISDLTKPDQPVSYINSAFERLTGYSAEEMIGQNCRILQGAEPDVLAINQIRRAIATKQECNVIIKNYRKDNSLFWNQLFLAPVPNDSGAITHYIGVQTDITAQKRYEQELAYHASHDILTSLPNRALLEDRLSQSWLTGLRRQQKVAILFINLDSFKIINDSLGHLTGDEVLKQTGLRIISCIRPGDTLARIGGDEFALLLTDLNDKAEIVVVAERILQVVASPLQINSETLHISASIGISVSDEQLTEPMHLVQQADLAMYRAKQLGRNNFQWYSSELDIASGKKLNLRAQLKKAIVNEEFELYYQPQIDALSGDVVGLEALLRWPHPELGFISPDEFIPLAENSGEIIPLGNWVINTASQYNKSLIERGISCVVMAVNVSSIQFGRADFVENLQQTIAQNGLDPRWFEIELTESLLFENTEQVILKLQQLRQHGVKISIDDFGTGYSSLSYLKRLPIDKLKIDRSFIQDIVSDKRDAAISKAIIGLAHHLDIKVIAEGVENEAQAALLRKSLCDEYQGYYFGKPMPADRLELYLTNYQQNRVIRPELVKGGKTLLLVDDEENILSALVRVMRREGYQILSCTSAMQAFEILAINQVQVIVSDQRMPGMSGTEFLSQVKDMYPDTIRIVLSGYTDLRSVTDAINKGAIYKFMTKPWQDNELRQEIKMAFSEYQKQLTSKLGQQ